MKKMETGYNFNTDQMRLAMIYMPALIPFVHIGKNRGKFKALWHSLWEACMLEKDLQEIVTRFTAINPDLKEDVAHLARHFTHLMCIHYPFKSDDYFQYESELISRL